MSKYDDRPYTVGKGKPPKEHSWKKGQSGNPLGPPKRKDRRRQILRDVLIDFLNEEMRITIDGKPVKITKKEALLMAMVHDSLEGTPAHRLKAFSALSAVGAFDIRPEDRASDRERTQRFIQRLSESCKANGLFDAEP